MITLTQLQAVFGPVAVLSDYVDPLNKTFEKYDISTTNRIAAFVAQVGVESQYFSHIIENLNYSAAGLLATFPTHFTTAEAAQYAHQPEKIANRAYANRYGNGPESSGDGWKYRGRGLIQITFSSNYNQAARDLGMDVDALVTYMGTPEGAAISAGWFWNSHKFNALADVGNIKSISIRINGGTNGLADRINYYNKGIKVF
jgi:putative chitinase